MESDQELTTFSPELIHALLQWHNIKNTTTNTTDNNNNNVLYNIKKTNQIRINNDALILLTEYLRLFVIEAVKRAHLEASLDMENEITPEHMERILLSLISDF